MSVLIGGQKHSAKIKGTGGGHSIHRAPPQDSSTPQTPPNYFYNHNGQFHRYGQDGKECEEHRVEREQRKVIADRIRDENRLEEAKNKNIFNNLLICKRKDLPHRLTNNINSYF